jgi:aminoglycoside 3-N-acetyltransferase
MKLLTQEQIASELQKLGIQAGNIVFVHSSLSSMGYVEGGTDTVVNAFLSVLGSAGTLVVPTFTFCHGRVANPVFDPVRDPSEMGRITEATRTRPGAQRSCHLLHSVAALGPHAAEITVVHGPSAWAADGPFWKLYELDAHILMLGVPYLRCTFFHVVEQLVQVRYRRWREVEARVRDANGNEQSLPTFVYSPKPGFQGNDFNKLGRLLERRGQAQVGAVGNAVSRLFRARDALEIGLAVYRTDPLLFVRTGNGYTTLPNGVLTEDLHNEKSVLDAALIYPNRP